MSGNRTCSFCGHHEDNVDHLNAGPRANICDRCVEGIAVNFSGGSHWDEVARTWVEHAPQSPWPHQRHSHFGDDVACSFCSKVEPDLQWLVGCRVPGTYICDECVGLYLTIARDPSTGPTATDRVTKRRSFRHFRWPWQAHHVDRATSL
jgi:ATP-dependent protease Clp ATPase subunit